MRRIIAAQESDFDVLTDVWEAAVRATHDFLTETMITELRAQVRHDYLKAVELRVLVEAGTVRGFLGGGGDKLEMLFVAPEARGQGIGRQLLTYAVEQLGVKTLDVNEQNPQALGFYEHQGFEIVGRSAVDAMGRPFPLLHMALRSR